MRLGRCPLDSIAATPAGVCQQLWKCEEASRRESVDKTGLSAPAIRSKTPLGSSFSRLPVMEDPRRAATDAPPDGRIVLLGEPNPSLHGLAGLLVSAFRPTAECMLDEYRDAALPPAGGRFCHQAPTTRCCPLAKRRDGAAPASVRVKKPQRFAYGLAAQGWGKWPRSHAQIATDSLQAECDGRSRLPASSSALL